MVNVVAAFAYHFCLYLPAPIRQFGGHLFAETCRRSKLFLLVAVLKEFFFCSYNRRRSTMRISRVRRSDSGNYSCVAANVLGEKRTSVSINVRYSGK